MDFLVLKVHLSIEVKVEFMYYIRLCGAYVISWEKTNITLELIVTSNFVINA
jgi:ribosomal protein L30E